MVATPHWLATEAGAKVLKRGGNAIEAIVAAGAALSVLYPHFCGLGGDAIWITADRSGKAKAFMGIGHGAEEAGAALAGLSAIPARGPLSTLLTACLVDSWDKVLVHSRSEWQGKETLAALLDDAITLADDGFATSPSQSFWYRFRQDEVAGWPGFTETFAADGMQRQPALAKTLRAIADKGVRDFYEGELAARIIAGLQAAGSPLTSKDLAATATRIETPLSIDYRGLTLLAPPPPTQGVTTLGIMGVLAGFDMAGLDYRSADYYHHLVEAVKQAFLDRPAIADPLFATVDTDRLLNPDRLGAKTRAIDPAQALPWPQTFKPGDTAFLSATDSEGRSVSMLQSLYFDWGSGVVAGDTGILWQNRGAAFSLDPASPNAYAPGKRPFYTLNPGMALKDGRPHLLYGTQGADGQPQTLALILSLMIDHGLDPLAALSQPRFLLGKTFSDATDSLKIEANVGDGVVDGLSAIGHAVSRIDAFSQLGGQAGVIRISDEGRIDGAHDPRSDGGAMGI
ncbi:MAG: gamma-glutamyltransferase family protein [Neorhizobium sp.]|nr:gamma-glutamyltransferase family protein [Neorhizobium sp.]